MHGGHFSKEKSMIFSQFARAAGCVQKFHAGTAVRNQSFSNFGQNLHFCWINKIKLVSIFAS